MIPFPKKRHRSGCSSRLSSVAAAIDSDYHDGTLMESSQKSRRNPSSSSSSFAFPFLSSPIAAAGFNDPSSADVLLRLYHEDSDSLSSSPTAGDGDSSDDVQVYLHSSVISRAKYFSALLSDRWSKGDRKWFQKINLGVSPNTGSILAHLTVLQLLYTDDFSTVVHSASAAILIFLWL